MERPVPKRTPGGSRPKPNLALLEARIRHGLSRGELGTLSGVSGKQIGLIERGLVRRSRPATLKGVARALEADVFDIFPERKRP